jgi:starch-binding outer membrane protein SusE/F
MIVIMKTKLFSLFIALFLFTTGSKAQSKPNCPPSWPFAHCISLIGPGVSDWSTDVYLTSADGNVFTLVDLQIKETSPGSGIGAEIKFRRDGCWDGCPGNPAGYSSATGTGFPTGSGESVPFGPNIKPTPGVWNVTFTLSTKSWSFTPGTPNPTVKIFGTATTPASGVSMAATSATTFVIKKVPLLAGNAQFEINTTPGGAPTLAVIGGTTFPDGVADDPAKFIPVSAANDYDVTLDLTSGAYTFKVATFPKIAIVGSGTKEGWPNDPQVDVNAMTTTDGVTYTINNIPLKTGAIKFRQDNSWTNNWGGSTWPSGTTGSGDIPSSVGNYNGTFNKTTGEYAFTLNTVAVVGSGVGGWPNDPQVDANQMTTVDGENYTLDGLVVTDGAAKFRQNNSWAVNSGGSTFPAGTSGVGDIPTTAGTYNLKYNIITGAYDFGANLGVSKFDVNSFKAYPNPTRGGWNITSANEEMTSLQVYDVQGKAVFTKFGATNAVSIDATELSKGVYFAKIATANGSTTLKLVKE